MRTSFPVAVIALALFFGCERSDESVTRHESLDLLQLAESAKRLSLMMGPDLKPDVELTAEILRELESILNYPTQLDGAPEVSQVAATLPWQPGVAGVMFDQAWHDSVRAGHYPGWDSLNTALDMRLDENLLDFGTSIHAVLRSDSLYHGVRLAEIYRSFEGVAEAWESGLVGDFPNCYAVASDEGREYVIREAEGDCPAGCTRNWYWYFRVRQELVDFVGYWDPQTEPVPDWWEDAYQVMESWSASHEN